MKKVISTYSRFIAVLLSVNLVYAQDAPVTPSQVYDRKVPVAQEYAVKQVPGETVNLRNLAVSWETVDLKIPGQGGLDLVVSRSHRAVSNSPMHFGDWHLGIPRIQIPTSPMRGPVYDPAWDVTQPNVVWATRVNLAEALDNISNDYGVDANVCSAVGFFIFNVDLNVDGTGPAASWAVYNNAPLTMSIPGHGTKTLMAPVPGTPYPAGTDYITTDNWRVECITKANAYASGYGGFKVYSPDGLIYTIDRLGYVFPGDWTRGTAGGSIEMQVTKIEDQNGNYLTYIYDELASGVNCGSACTALLTSIEANDGRKVYFDYTPGSSNLESYRDEQYALITKVRYISNSTTNTEEEIVYAYCKIYDWKVSSTCNSTIQLENPFTAYNETRLDAKWMFLRKVTYADDTRWRYSYAGFATYGRFRNGETNGIDPAFGYSSFYIDQVELPAGGKIVYDYDYGEPGYSSCDGDRDAYCGYFNFTDRPFPRLKTRTVTGRAMPTGTWSYSHSSPPGQYFETVTVTGPTRKDIYKYVQGLDTWQFLNSKDAINDPNFSAHPWSQTWAPMFGRLDEHEVRTLTGNTVLQKIDYDYVQFSDQGYAYYLWGNDYFWYGDDTLLWPIRADVQVSEIITTDYSSSLAKDYTVSTPADKFDEYNSREQVTETGWDGSTDSAITRTTDFTFAHSGLSTGPWVIGRVNTQTLGGKTIDYDYDPATMRVSKRNKYGMVEDYQYHSTGDLHKIIWTRDGQSHTNRYVNYHRGIPERQFIRVDPADSSQDIQIDRNVDDLGRIVWQEDGESHRINYAFDGAGKLTFVDPPTQADTEIQYILDSSSKAWLQSIATTSIYKQTIDIDGFGRKLTVREEDLLNGGSAIAKSFEYDGAGRVSAETVAYEWSGPGSEAIAPKINYNYDEFDRVTSMTHVNGTDYVTTCYRQFCNTGYYFNYDPSLVNGYIQTDERGYQAGYEFRAYGDPGKKELTRIVQQIDPSGTQFAVTRIERDVFGNVVTVQQGSGSAADLKRMYVYNSKNLLKTVTNPETGVTTYGYDEIGNRISIKVGSNQPTLYEFDGANRLTAVIYPDPTPANPNDEKPAPDVNYTYYKDDRLQTIGHSTLSWSYTYSPEGLVENETLIVDGLSYSVQNAYSPLGDLASITYPAGNEINFLVDAFGRPQWVKDVAKATAYASNIEYWPDGSVKSFTYGNGATYSSTRTDRLLPDVLQTTRGGDIVKLDYNYDKSANVVGITDSVVSNNNRSLGYDGLGRLTSANGFWGSGTIHYDNVGNITSQVMGGLTMNYIYNASTNLLAGTTSAGIAQNFFGYDSYGNVKDNWTIGASYIYNDASQLIAVPSLSYELKYRYDGHGRRAQTIKEGSAVNSGFNQAGKLLFKANCTINESEQFYYLGDMLLAKEEGPCMEGCHPAQ